MKDSDILSYLPPVLSKITEFKAVAKAENDELSAIWGKIHKILDNQFIETLDETGIKRFEKMLGIASYGELNDRRFRIKTTLGSRTPFTVKALALQLDFICGEGNYELFVEPYKILVHLTNTENATAVKELLYSMAPANMVIEVSRLYRRYKTVGCFKNSMLTKFTHGYIKEGGMN